MLDRFTHTCYESFIPIDDWLTTEIKLAKQHGEMRWRFVVDWFGYVLILVVMFLSENKILNWLFILFTFCF